MKFTKSKIYFGISTLFLSIVGVFFLNFTSSNQIDLSNQSQPQQQLQSVSPMDKPIPKPRYFIKFNDPSYYPGVMFEKPGDAADWIDSAVSNKDWVFDTSYYDPTPKTIKCPVIDISKFEFSDFQENTVPPGYDHASAVTGEGGYSYKTGNCPWYPPNNYCAAAECNGPVWSGRYTMQAVCDNSYYYFTASAEGGEPYCRCYPGQELVYSETAGWTCAYPCPTGNPSGNPTSKFCFKKDLSCKTNAPTEPGTGVKVQAETDYVSGGEHPLTFVRTFRSSMRDPTVQGVWRNWIHNWQSRIEAYPGAGAAGDGNMARAWIILEDGSQPAYKPPTGASNPGTPPTYVPGQTSYTTYKTVTWISEIAGDRNTLQESAEIYWTYADGKMNLTGKLRTGWRYAIAEDDSVKEYNKYSQISKITQRNGWVYTMTYDANQKLMSVKNQFGRELKFAYDTKGRLSKVAPPGANLNQASGFADSPITYNYEEPANLGTGVYSSTDPRRQDQLTSVVWQDGKVKKYFYESSDVPQLVTGIVDENNVRIVTYNYYSDGRIVTIYRAGKPGIMINYSATTTKYFEGDFSKPKVTYTYNDTASGLRMPTAMTGTGTCETCTNDHSSLEYNADGTLKKTIEKDGTVTFYNYDTKGRETESANFPASYASSTAKPALKFATKVISQQWHATFNLLTKKAEPNQLTNIVYDRSGIYISNYTINKTSDSTGAKKFQATKLSPGEFKQSYTYFSNGLTKTLKSYTDNLITESISYVYDSLGNKKTVNDVLTGISASVTSFDAAGNVKTAKDSLGNTLTFTYTERGLLKSHQAGSEITTLIRNENGSVKEIVAPSGIKTSFNYNAVGELTSALYNSERFGSFVENKSEEKYSLLNLILNKSYAQLLPPPPTGPLTALSVEKIIELSVMGQAAQGNVDNALLARQLDHLIFNKTAEKKEEQSYRALFACTPYCDFFSKPTFTLKSGIHILTHGHMEGIVGPANTTQKSLIKDKVRILWNGQAIVDAAIASGQKSYLSAGNAAYTVKFVDALTNFYEVGSARLGNNQFLSTNCLTIVVSEVCQGPNGVPLPPGLTLLLNRSVTWGINEVVTIYPSDPKFCPGPPVVVPF